MSPPKSLRDTVARHRLRDTSATTVLSAPKSPGQKSATCRVTVLRNLCATQGGHVVVPLSRWLDVRGQEKNPCDHHYVRIGPYLKCSRCGDLKAATTRKNPRTEKAT